MVLKSNRFRKIRAGFAPGTGPTVIHGPVNGPAEVFPLEQEGASPSPTSAKPVSLSPVAGSTIDLISKSAAVFAVVLYGCGFLITSIQHFSYGFVETNPFRPRIVSAGFWFLLFVAAPPVLVMELRRLRGKSENQRKWLDRFSTKLYFYCISSAFFGQILGNVFDFQGADASADSTWIAWLLPVLLGVGVLVFLDQWKRLPRMIAPIMSLGFVGFLLVFGIREGFVHHHASEAAITMWFLPQGWLAHYEMSSRSWRVWSGNWQQSLSFLSTLLLVFASTYYPHLKPSWGGGAPIPVTIYFTKDSTIMSNQNVGALLVDESDAGLYVVGKNDKKATFIPRSAVGLVYYSDDISGFSLAKPK